MPEIVMRKTYVLFLIPLILYIALLGVMPQMEPDEARYSLIPSAMNQSGNYITPHIKNTVYLEKPPLVYWATALSFKIFGENDFSARLFVGLCAWGCILLIYFIGRHFRDEKTGLYAAMLLTISAFPFFLGRINILDTPLTFFVCLSIWLGYLGLKQEKKYFIYLFYGACGLGFLTKGIIGILFPFAVLIGWLVWIGQWRKILKLASPVGIIIFTLLVGPWLILAQKENPDFLWFFFVREHVLRFTTKMHGKSEPFYFYLPVLIGGLTPWLFYLIKAWNHRFIRESLYGEKETKLLLVWFVLIFAFYQMSSSKLAPYIAPIFPPLILFAASFFRRYEEELPQNSRIQEITYRATLILQACFFGVALLLPPILNRYSDAEKGLVVMVSGKWWLYIAAPTLALILMTFLPDWMQKKFKKGWFVTIYILCALFLGGIVFPLNDFLSPYRSARVAKEAIARWVPKDELLYQYRVNFYGIDFYNKIRTPIVEDFGELGDGIVKLGQEERKKYFLNTDTFFNLCTEKKQVYCITQHKKKLQQITQRFPKTRILWDNKAFYLLLIET
jgi:4-amino-4-deoxy-L-arabinose transferase-like glycosyltransferase